MSGMLKSVTSVTEELLDERKRDRKAEELQAWEASRSIAMLSLLFRLEKQSIQ